MVHIVRVLFLMLVSAVALAYTLSTVEHGDITYYLMVGSVILAFAIMTGDLLVKKKNLAALSGLFFGLLVGVVISLCMGYLVDQIANIFIYRPISHPVDDTPAALTAYNKARAFAETYNDTKSLIDGGKLLLGLMITYTTVSFILQTKDDFRFIVPYVEFRHATKGPRPLILDTSVIIDGRIADMAATGIFESKLLVPRFVLNELQAIADSGDRLKRMKGRRGLEILQRLQAMPKVELHLWDGTLANTPESDGVDQKLVALAQQESGRVVTNDYNLNKVAQLRGVDVVNINNIAEALKPVFLPGETMKVRIVKPGESPGQGVGYLEDGTMVVVEGARERVGTEIELIVTNALQTSAGKMIFGRTEAGHAPATVASGKNSRNAKGPESVIIGDKSNPIEQPPAAV